MEQATCINDGTLVRIQLIRNKGIESMSVYWCFCWNPKALEESIYWRRLVFLNASDKTNQPYCAFKVLKRIWSLNLSYKGSKRYPWRVQSRVKIFYVGNQITWSLFPRRRLWKWSLKEVIIYYSDNWMQMTKLYLNMKSNREKFTEAKNPLWMSDETWEQEDLLMRCKRSVL